MSDPSKPTGQNPEQFPEPFPEPGNLRFLRRLVTTLMVVMIGGLLVIVGLFVIRFSSAPSDLMILPEGITLPDGVKALNFSVGPGWYGVVTDGDTILIFDRATGSLRQSVTIEPGK
ncbi:MAG: DUF6476 family protein [Rhodobacteraceae bacterium]|nr:DUF6476 family protein [Paracoccaceae bacterium]